jgi:hypothetical protein
MPGTGNDFIIEHNDLIDLIRAAVSKGASISFRARGSSMSPFIKNGDLITVSPPDNPIPRCGDVMAFLHPLTGGIIVHRLIKMQGDHFVMKGDNRYGTDGCVPKEGLLGRVTGVKRGGKDIKPGLGPERLFIALFSRTGLLVPFVRLARTFLRRGKDIS